MMLQLIRRLLLWLVTKVDAAILRRDRKKALPRGTIVEIVCPCKTCREQHADGLWVVLGYYVDDSGGWPYLCVRHEVYRPKQSVSWHRTLKLVEQREYFSREHLKPI